MTWLFITLAIITYCMGYTVSSVTLARAEARSKGRDPILEDALFPAMISLIWFAFIPVIWTLVATRTPTVTEIKGARARRAQFKHMELERSIRELEAKLDEDE